MHWPVLCLLVTALLLLPLNTVIADAKESKELYKVYAHTKLLNDKQYQCINKLWDIESHWDSKANNNESSAYGIPQLLHMTETNPFKQIDLGIAYIVHRYKTPCAALTHHRNVGHY